MRGETSINVLITSVGRRTSLLQYFKRELEGIGELIATDCSCLAPALYMADRHYIVPRIDHPNYIDILKKICIEEKITSILTLIDPELSLLGTYREEFKDLGVTTIVSSFDECQRWLDKYSASKFYQEHNYKHALSFNSFIEFSEAINKNEIRFPVFIKPQKGSGSLRINKANNINEAKVIFESSEEMIIQEFLDGQELGVDVYVDMLSKEVVSIFIKEKMAMRAGETDKAKSTKSEPLFNMIIDLLGKTDLIGPLDIDVFNVNGEYYISEINPRFGGGYPLAYECGINFPMYIIKNTLGKLNTARIGNYDENVYMLKHDSLTIKRDLKKEAIYSHSH